MMYIKMTGAALVIISSSFLGLSLCSDIRRRIEIMTEFRNLLLMIRSGIEYNRQILPEILENSAEMVCGETSGFAREAAAELMKDEKIEFAAVWHDTVVSVYGKSPVGKNLDLFLEPGRVMGLLDMKLRISGIDSCISALDNQIRQEQAEMPEKCRIRRNLGFLTGLFITIVLI